MEFHVTFDFGDDILYAKRDWTEEYLREFVRGFAERGISAVHMLHTFDGARLISRDGDTRYWDFMDRVNNPLAVVADECHKQGMKFIAVIKPNDRGGGMPFSPRPVTFNSKGELEQDFLGGKYRHGHPWVLEHQNMKPELQPALQEKEPRKPVGVLRLWHEGPNLKGTNFKIYFSKDNLEYFPYTGPQKLRISEQKRMPPVYAPYPERLFGPEGTFTCVEFSGLKLDAPFFAVEAEGGTELANTLSALTEMIDIDGKEAVFTYGLTPLIATLLEQSQSENWKNNGIAFDAAKGSAVPGRGYHYMSSGGRHRHEVGKRAFIGFARGKNRYLRGVLELAYPEARAFCVKTAETALDSGADMVDIRLNSHEESLDWENYGFGGSIAAEYKKRYGKDITKEPFDRSLWRKLRGEYITQTIKEMGDAVRSRGKKVSVQLFTNFNHPAEELCWMEFFWDWKNWISSGLVDSATLAGFGFKQPFYREAIDSCRSAGVPLIMTPAAFDLDDAGWKEYGPEFFDHCEQDGFAAFNIYESSSVSLLDTDGIRFTCPSLWKMVGERKGQIRNSKH